MKNQDVARALFEKYAVPDPDYAKQVTIGRTFTNVDAYYQLEQATEEFGLYGTGWGFRDENVEIVETVKHETVDLKTVSVEVDNTGAVVNRTETTTQQIVPFVTYSAIYTATFFYVVDGKEEKSFPVTVDQRFTPGQDTCKKLRTNAQSKALSFLGFALSIYKGEWEDSDTQKQARATAEVTNLGKTIRNLARREIPRIKTVEELESKRLKVQRQCDGEKITVELANEVFDMINTRIQEIQQGKL